MGCSGCHAKRGGGEEITNYEGLEQALAQGRKLVVYEDAVIDVSSFIAEHPGGAAVLEPYIGEWVNNLQ